MLDNICLELPEKENLAIYGDSGSGKSLLAKALIGDLFHAGTVRFLKNGAPYTPSVAFIPQAFTIKNLSNVTDLYYQQRYNSFDSEDSLTLMQELLKHGGKQAISNWAEQFSLTHRLHTPLIQLSNGELKKAQLISYLLSQPEVLILDKVFTGLDIESRKTLHKVLNHLSESGVKIIIITDSHELPHCITQFAEMVSGKIINRGPIEKLGFTHRYEGFFFKGEIPALSPARCVAPLISMRDVTIKYGAKIILKNITWQVKCGECWLIKGHNGAGKSTLLSLITADNPQAYSQQLHLFGRKRGTGESIWDIKKKIGFVSPELFNFFDKSSTVFETIASGLFDMIGLFRKLNEEQRKVTGEWIRFFDLKEKAQVPLLRLSAGEQRLVLIARALIKSPMLLALDEPFQGLDHFQVRSINTLLDRIHNETGISILFINHYEEDIPGCIKNVLELKNGIQNIYTRETKKHKFLQATMI